MKYPLTILVVDDVPEITQGMCRIMKRSFDRCLQASNGIEALALCEKERVDVLVTDLVMPKMGGLDLVLAIKERFPHVHPVVVITGEASQQVLDQVKQLEIPTFTKPLDVKALLDYFRDSFAESPS